MTHNPEIGKRWTTTHDVLDSHGGGLSGFFLITGGPSKLDGLVSSTEWTTHMARAGLHLEDVGAIRGVTGDEVMKRMTIWKSAIPS